VQTKKDELFVDFTFAEVEARMKLFLDPVMQHQNQELQTLLGGTAGWIKEKAKDSGFASDKIHPYMVSPFDIRFVYYDPQLLGRARYSVMKHMLANNMGLVFMRQSSAQKGYDHFLAVRSLVTDRVFYSAHGAPFLFPLYLYPIAQETRGKQNLLLDTSPWPPGKDGCVPNLNPKFIAEVEERLGLKFVPDGTGDLKKTFGPEDILHYIYAVFHSPTYRERYAEFLKIDFPRVPLTSDRELFRRLCTLGRELVALHLLESPTLSKLITSYPVPGDHRVEKGHPKYLAPGEPEPGTGEPLKNGRVYINKKQYFDGIAPEVWEFHVGGYQVCEKWLKDRQGRTLSSYDDLTHYRKIVVALKETMRLMEEIEEAIPSWPIQ